MPATLVVFMMLDVVSIAIKSLAVVGGAVLGGLGTGGLTGLLTRVTTTRKLPVKMRWTVRGLGGVASGWLLALLLFGGGGGLGFGGAGGPHLGSSESSSSNNVGDADERHNVVPAEITPTLPAPPADLRIEVLGDDPLRKMTPAGTLDVSHCYRLLGEPKLYSLSEMKQLITHRLAEKPALQRIEIVLYKDSPARRVKRAADLEQWLDELVAAQKKPSFKLLVNDKIPTDAPVR
jgi:hypothetical protein